MICCNHCKLLFKPEQLEDSKWIDFEYEDELGLHFRIGESFVFAVCTHCDGIVPLRYGVDFDTADDYLILLRKEEL